MLHLTSKYSFSLPAVQHFVTLIEGLFEGVCGQLVWQCAAVALLSRRLLLTGS